jgi:hypothetical protein
VTSSRVFSAPITRLASSTSASNSFLSAVNLRFRRLALELPAVDLVPAQHHRCLLARILRQRLRQRASPCIAVR